jgi:hypothetical protein
MGVIVMLSTNLHIQIYRLETQLLGRNASAICGFCGSTQGNSEHANTVRNAIKKLPINQSGYAMRTLYP